MHIVVVLICSMLLLCPQVKIRGGGGGSVDYGDVSVTAIMKGLKVKHLVEETVLSGV
jgi:hypothetical protein